MLNNYKINTFNNFNLKEKYNKNGVSEELIRPKNYTWKGMFKLMNKIKIIWLKQKFDNKYTLDSQSLNKFIYTNLKNCSKTPPMRLKFKYLESEINSFFQTNLFDYLSEEQELYDYYDNLFNNKKYIPKKDENDEILFGEFIIKYKDYFYSIQKNKKSMRQLKKLRWYLIMDENNFFGEDKKTSNFNLNDNNFFIDFSKEVENNNDSFDEIETKIMYNEYIKNDKDNKIDNLEEIIEKNIINDELIDKLLKDENNPFFYIIKLIYLSISIFCKAIICHLLNDYLKDEKNKSEDGKYLINEYLLCFNNFVDSSILISKKCTNINVAMNYLYNELFENYPKFPKFSIFRMCIRIWFTEANTLLIGEKSILSQIKDKLASLFKNNIKEELYNKMEENPKNNSKSVNYCKSKSFGLSTSFMLFQSDNTKTKMNDIFSQIGFGSKYINTYNNSDKQYKILEKGLSIINDTFSNEYSVYLLNTSTIDTNSFYRDLVNNFNNSVEYYIKEIFNGYLNDGITIFEPKNVIEGIFNYFNNYFFKTKIISNLRKNIYEKVYLEVKNNLLEYTKNKYSDKNFFKNKKKQNNQINNSNSSSTKSNISINLNSKSLLKSSIFNFNNDFNFGNSNFNNNIEINYDKYKTEIINYIKKNIGFNNKSIDNEIGKKVEDINEQINIYELFDTVEKWHEEYLNKIEDNDEKIEDELSQIKRKTNLKIPHKFDQLKRYLLSYSLQYDWAFIKKVKNIENYTNKNNINENDEDIEMAENDNEFEIDYFSNFDNIENINNNSNINNFGLNFFNNFNNNANVNNNLGANNLRSSLFDY